MKGADSLLRSGTDADIVEKRGEIIAQKYNTRQNEKRHGVNDQSARESIGKLQQELQEITAAKEAEAIEKQLGLMKAASALDAEYERLSRKSVSDIGRAKLGTSGVGKFLIDVGVVGTQIAADAAAKAVANAIIPGSSIVLKGIRSFGDASQEARKAGASVGQQVTYGGLTAGKDMVLEKAVDGLVGTYGKGAADNNIKKKTATTIENKDKRKAAERLLGAGGESLEAFSSSILEPLLKSSYNEKTIRESYSSDVWFDAAREAAISGVLSGAVSAFDDAKNMGLANAAAAIDRATEINKMRHWQKAMRQGYIGSAQQDAESYASLIRLMLEKKGDGHRW